MTDYTKLNDPELLHACGDSGQKWADAFCQKHPGVNVDPDLLMAWFANAIEHSTDIRTGRVHNGDHAQWLLDNGISPTA